MLANEGEPLFNSQFALIVADLSQKDRLEKYLRVSPDRFKSTPIVSREEAEKRMENGETFDIVVIDISTKDWGELVERFISKGPWVYVTGKSANAIGRVIPEVYRRGAKDCSVCVSDFFWRHENPPEGG